MTDLTNTINNPISKEGFSWNRVKMLYSFYFPTIKNQMIAYAIATFIVSAASILLTTIDPLFIILVALAFTAIIYALYWNPIIFSRRNFHLTETILPVSGNEKVVFYFSYSFIIIPLIVIGTAILGALVTYLFPDSRELIDRILNIDLPPEVSAAFNVQSFGLAYLISVVATWYEMVITSLFAVTYFKKNKALMAIILTFAVSMVTGIIGGISGFIFGYDEYNSNSGSLSMDNILNFSIVITMIFNVAMTYFTIRTIKYRQI